jgi:DNA-binding NarL/FixJ family response regulator
LTVCGEAADGAEAIEKAKELKPDLVLLDLAMPTLNGAEVASVIKQTLPKVLFVVFTVHGDEAERLAAAVGCDVVLHKSDGLNHFVKRVQAYV